MLGVFLVCFGVVNCMLIFFCENRSRVCFVVNSCYCPMVSVVEIPEAATSSRFFDFLLRLCKAGLVLQGREALMPIILSPRRSLRTGFELRCGTRGENQSFRV